MGVTARRLKQELLIHLDYGLPFGDVVVRPALATLLIQDQERPPDLALAWLTYVRRGPADGSHLEQEHLALGAADLTPPERSTLERLRHRIKGLAWTHYQGPVGH